MAPDVSVIIPTYNRLGFLQQAVESSLSQRDVSVEVLVVDDGSTDGSLEFASTHSDPRFRALRQPHKGACAARNLGLKEARGRYVKFLDDDDYLADGCFVAQVETMDSFGAVGDLSSVTFGDVVLVDQSGDELPTGDEEVNKSPTLAELLVSNIPISSPLHRRSSLIAIDGFDERLSRSQEYDLHLRLHLSGLRFRHLPGVIFYQRVHHAGVRISNRPIDAAYIAERTSRIDQRVIMLESSLGELDAAVSKVLAKQYLHSARLALDAGLRAEAIRATKGARSLLSGRSKLETNAILGLTRALPPRAVAAIHRKTRRK